MQPGQAATVQVQLTASGDETLPDVQLALQLPQGWTAVPVGPTDFSSVAPGTAPTATFQVTPASYAPTRHQRRRARNCHDRRHDTESGVSITGPSGTAWMPTAGRAANFCWNRLVVNTSTF
jgi:hypothetical protein